MSGDLIQGELDFTAVPWIAPGTCGRHVLNTRIAEAVTRWWGRVEANGGLPPVGLYDDLTEVLERYARVAVREALAARREAA